MHRHRFGSVHVITLLSGLKSYYQKCRDCGKAVEVVKPAVAVGV